MKASEMIEKAQKELEKIKKENLEENSTKELKDMSEKIAKMLNDIEKKEE